MAKFKMRRAIAIIAIALVLTTHANKEGGHKVKENHNEVTDHRGKRSLDDEEDKPFWANRGKRSIDKQVIGGDVSDSKVLKYSPDDSYAGILDKNMRHETPFWGNRGRRQSAEVIEDIPLPMISRPLYDNTFLERIFKTNSICIDGNYFLKNIMFSPNNFLTVKERREEEVNPFWGNRGRRSDEEIEESPFWGNRGRRYYDTPVRGANVRRDDINPFWGARGRRDDDNPFWGARGRREEDPPFWGTRGRREDEVILTDKQGEKENILDLLKSIKSDLAQRLKRKNPQKSLKDRERNAEVQLFKGKTRINSSKTPTPGNDFIGMKSLRQDTMYAEQPYYVVVDRSSRSVSSEDDPYFITRGKKKVTPEDLAKAARDRRGIFEQIVKNNNDDPYFVTRGKKEDTNSKHDQLTKAKDLICSAVNLINSTDRNKRDLSDRDRNRRNILKKLAAQLKSDPYFVSRGKKSLDLNVEHTMKQMYELCS